MAHIYLSRRMRWYRSNMNALVSANIIILLIVVRFGRFYVVKFDSLQMSAMWRVALPSGWKYYRLFSSVFRSVIQFDSWCVFLSYPSTYLSYRVFSLAFYPTPVYRVLLLPSTKNMILIFFEWTGCGVEPILLRCPRPSTRPSPPTHTQT